MITIQHKVLNEEIKQKTRQELEEELLRLKQLIAEREEQERQEREREEKRKKKKREQAEM